MTNDEKLMAQALEALVGWCDQPDDAQTYDACMQRAETAIITLRARLAKTDGYACHCDLDPGQKPDACVFDFDRILDCVYAQKLSKESKGRNDCEYWQPIKWEEK